MENPKIEPRKTYDSRLHALFFDIRYDPKYAMWDMSGEITDQVLRRYPATEVLDAQPSLVSLQLENRVKLRWELGRINFGIVEVGGADLPHFVELCSTVADLIIDEFEVEVLSRVGFKVQYVFGMTREKSLKELRQKFLGDRAESIDIDGSNWALEEPMVRLKYASGGMAYVVKVEHGGYKIDVNHLHGIPKDLFNAELVVENNGLQVDVDCFTETSVSRASLDLKRWMESQILRMNEITEKIYGKSIGLSIDNSR